MGLPFALRAMVSWVEANLVLSEAKVNWSGPRKSKQHLRINKRPTRACLASFLKTNRFILVRSSSLPTSLIADTHSVLVGHQVLVLTAQRKIPPLQAFIFVMLMITGQIDGDKKTSNATAKTIYRFDQDKWENEENNQQEASIECWQINGPKVYKDMGNLPRSWACLGSIDMLQLLCQFIGLILKLFFGRTNKSAFKKQEFKIISFKMRENNHENKWKRLFQLGESHRCSK